MEIWAPGLEIVIDSGGKGHFKQVTTGKSGNFSISSTEFSELRRRTEPFRLSPETITAGQLSEKNLNDSWRCDGNYVTDNGSISFHWIGPSLDQFYFVDFGCDREKNAARNQTLHAVLASLPVPAPDSWP